MKNSESLLPTLLSTKVKIIICKAKTGLKFTTQIIFRLILVDIISQIILRFR